MPATQQPGNFDLFLNGVNWLAEQESQITIRPKPFETRQLIPSRAMSLQVFGISVILMPLAVLRRRRDRLVEKEIVIGQSVRSTSGLTDGN